MCSLCWARKQRSAARPQLPLTDAGRIELADKERAEGEVLARYLPQPLSDEEVKAIVDAAVAQAAASGATGPAAMGAVMKAVQAQTSGRTDGAAVRCFSACSAS
jgi:uncharacterized protein YqeY